VSKPRKPVDPLSLISEKDWTKTVIDLAHAYKWRVAHFRAAMTKHGWRTPVQADGAGFPDLVLVRGDRVIFAELKTEKGRLTRQQYDWRIALCSVAHGREANVQVHVWRPSDFDEVQGILK